MTLQLTFFVLLASTLLLGGCWHFPSPSPSSISWSSSTGEKWLSMLPEKTNKQLVESIVPSLVRIGTLQQQNALANDILLDPSKVNWHGRWVALETWKVITAAHLFENSTAHYIAQTDQGNLFTISNVWKDESDLALIRIDGELIPYSQIWQKVDLSQQLWLVSVVDRTLLTGVLISRETEFITTSLPLLPGMSGSPLFTQAWVLIGINIAISNQDTVESYAQLIPIPFWSTFLDWYEWK